MLERGPSAPLPFLIMRFTQDWPLDQPESELTKLYEERLAHLTDEDRLLIAQEIACLCEASYRRGFQQGHASGEADSMWYRKPSQTEIYSWRFEIPLEYAAPTPGYYVNEKDPKAQRVWKNRRLGDFSSLKRVAVEAPGVSEFLERLFNSVVDKP